MDERSAREKLCEMFGFDPELTGSIQVNIPVNGPITVATVVVHSLEDTGLSAICKTFKFEEIV